MTKPPAVSSVCVPAPTAPSTHLPSDHTVAAPNICRTQLYAMCIPLGAWAALITLRPSAAPLRQIFSSSAVCGTALREPSIPAHVTLSDSRGHGRAGFRWRSPEDTSALSVSVGRTPDGLSDRGGGATSDCSGGPLRTGGRGTDAGVRFRGGDTASAVGGVQQCGRVRQPACQRGFCPRRRFLRSCGRDRAEECLTIWSSMCTAVIPRRGE